MEFVQTKVSGFCEVRLAPFEDERGAFMRMFCVDAYRQMLGPDNEIKQINRSNNLLAGTIRGFHAQKPPDSEDKIVFCLAGSAIDLVIDLRTDSKTFLKLEKIHLDCGKFSAAYVPKGCAHAVFITDDNTELVYLSTSKYQSNSEITINPRDPLVVDQFNADILHISKKDREASYLGSTLEAQQKLSAAGF